MNSETLWLQVPAAKTHSTHCEKNSSALNKLNYITAKLYDLQGIERPYIDEINIILFIADHGVVIDGKTSLAEPITYEKLNYFYKTKKNVNNKPHYPIPKIELISLGTRSNLKHIKGIVHATLGTNTENFCHSPAMSREQLAKAINLGRQTAQRIKLNGNKLFVAREINKANILSAAAIAVALLDINVEELSFLDDTNKNLVCQSLTKHKKQLTSPIEILRHLGSFEIAALTGSYMCCAHMGLPILVDGYASTVAALIVSRLCPTATPWFLFSQSPANEIHNTIYEQLRVKPLLQNSGRFEGTNGITSALSLIHHACTSHNEALNYKKDVLLRM